MLREMKYLVSFNPQNCPLETSLVVQWLRIPVNARDTGLIPGLGTKIPHAMGQLSPRSATTEPMP